MNKRRRDMVLGPCSVISLAGARDLAHEAYRKRRSGIDPIEARSAEQSTELGSITFDKAVDHFLKDKQRTLPRSQRTRRLWWCVILDCEMTY
jgi:hypothetical protein